MAKKQDDKNQIKTVIDQKDSMVSANITESYIFTTKDKVRILYDEYGKALRESSGIGSYLGMIITLIITLCTCEFKGFLVFDASTMRAIVVCLLIVFVLLAIRSIGQRFKNKSKLTFTYFYNELQGKETSKDEQDVSH